MSLQREIALNRAAEANKQFRSSLIFGGIGLLFGGLILGIFAFVYAGRAERLGHPQAIVGKVIGTIDVLANIVAIVIVGIYVAVNAG